jgi:hypothetical protein
MNEGPRITRLRARSDIVSCVSPSSNNTTHHWQGCVQPSPLDHARALVYHSYASRSSWPYCDLGPASRDQDDSVENEIDDVGRSQWTTCHGELDPLLSGRTFSATTQAYGCGSISYLGNDTHHTTFALVGLLQLPGTDITEPDGGHMEPIRTRWPCEPDRSSTIRHASIACAPTMNRGSH